MSGEIEFGNSFLVLPGKTYLLPGSEPFRSGMLKAFAQTDWQ